MILIIIQFNLMNKIFIRTSSFKSFFLEKALLIWHWYQTPIVSVFFKKIIWCWNTHRPGNNSIVKEDYNILWCLRLQNPAGSGSKMVVLYYKHNMILILIAFSSDKSVMEFLFTTIKTDVFLLFVNGWGKNFIWFQKN